MTEKIDDVSARVRRGFALLNLASMDKKFDDWLLHINFLINFMLINYILWIVTCLISRHFFWRKISLKLKNCNKVLNDGHFKIFWKFLIKCSLFFTSGFVINTAIGNDLSGNYTLLYRAIGFFHCAYQLKREISSASFSVNLCVSCYQTQTVQ